ncbi:hypothetical protein AM588_10001419 [Phytophthora nicotianae]|uniref:UTP-monosaccharide-1-phosphate uridylyltransferase n=1 Tax=Phytophthora nicotianae TaxID=4792 RepID=A0A0W8CSN3_PHYNI|nr:hypothetical protein AM588_10001419 [Phytophthora nicotianae]
MSVRTQFAMGNKDSIDKSHDTPSSAAQDARSRVLSALQAWDQLELLALLSDKPDSPLYQQLLHFDNWYKGGVDGYLSTATKLYAELRGEPDQDEKADVWSDWRPSNPSTSSELAALDSVWFAELEQKGLENLDKCCFVIVAGGLGERLGYQGIKLRLPVETLTHTSYLEAYIQHLLAMQRLANAQSQTSVQIPMAIMTSDSTHEATLSFLKEHKNFGMAEGQLVLIKQEKVPCVDVIEGSEPKLKLAKDASGGIVRFTSPSNKHSTLFNVEYHELDQFLRTRAKTEYPDGDINDLETGFSPFPGNINGIVAALDSYVSVLETSKGFVPEVFNPKFRANTKCAFKSPARLECMMQDYPKLLVQYQIQHHDCNQGVGLVQFPSSVVYSPCKNDAASASEKVKNDIPPQCASSAEHEVFAVNRLKLKALGVSMPKEIKLRSYLDVPVDCSGPQIVFGSGFALSQTTLAKKFTNPSAIKLTARSTLIVEGADVTFDALDLDGAVRVVACPGANVRVKSLCVKNAGVEYESVSSDSDPVESMRGYRLKQIEVKEFRFDTPGNYEIDG